MNSFQSKLKEHTQKVSENLYEFNSSISILYTISENYEKKSVKKYGRFFVTTQRLCIQNSILSLAKIFEISKSSVNLNNINNYILTNIIQLPALGVIDQNEYKHFKIDFKASEFKIDTIYDDEGKLISSKTRYELNKNYACALISYLIKRHEEIINEYEQDIKILKNLRDTKIAHTDKKAKKIETTTWNQFEKLSEYVVEYLDIVEHVFLATSRFIDADSKRNAHSLNRMLQDFEKLSN